MSDTPMDDREFLKHCAGKLPSKILLAGELARLTRMAGMVDVAHLWEITDTIRPGASIAIDNTMKMSLVVSAMCEAKHRLDATLARAH